MGTKEMITVAAYTGGKSVPSARYRVRQLISEVKAHDINITEHYSIFSKYPPKQKALRPFWGAGVLASRVPSIIAGYKADVTLLQRELISTLISLEPLTKSPRILDVDDAIFMNRNGKVAKKLSQLSQHIICGNEFLAETFKQWNDNVSIIPTAVDTIKYSPRKILSEKKVIGWMGTAGNFSYLYQIAPALEKLCFDRNDCLFRVVSNERPVFNSKLDSCVEYVKWTPENEVEQLQSMAVGIMPLKDGDWERGKCSFKMLQYMACGVPVVVSPVGMNRHVLSLGEIGFSAVSQADWIERINDLLDNEKLSEKLGSQGRTVVERNFSHEIIASQLAGVIKKVA